MVITKITSGLGNQMFQYATGRAIANCLGAELKLDIGGFDKDRVRRYELDRFKINAEIAFPEDIRVVAGVLGTRNGTVAKLVRNICHRQGSVGRIVAGSRFVERHFHFDPNVSNIKDDVYVQGKWQSAKYFSDIYDILKDEFQLKFARKEDAELSELMEKDEFSVSLHVRRGDYVHYSQCGQIYTVLPTEYYKMAVKYIETQLSKPRFYIFSDDLDWLKENLHIEGATVVDMKGPDRGPRDLFLMTKCRHHIISNSTFSWWGAWLSSISDGIVCGPKQWFAPTTQKKRNMSDLFPPSWIKL